jgi:hypothetical protein
MCASSPALDENGFSAMTTSMPELSKAAATMHAAAPCQARIGPQPTSSTRPHAHLRGAECNNKLVAQIASKRLGHGVDIATFARAQGKPGAVAVAQPMFTAIKQKNAITATVFVGVF